ncbi:LANO_0H07052g1_1 [Lachancea nothofagi CBS 11611]|uniref:LANO_0H07052g1_1 n=1 Tax=Lachancea nothofagi CBS 11611 TaxID=1266666 RepID=A0A1G4KLK3_9SACH|nr:LANO_0H07052g1_1 [Lachancea nothofagi CBS 11611]
MISTPQQTRIIIILKVLTGHHSMRPMSMKSDAAERPTNMQEDMARMGVSYVQHTGEAGMKSFTSNEQSVNARANDDRNLSRSQPPYPTDNASSVGNNRESMNNGHSTTDILDNFFQPQKSHASSVTSASTTGLAKSRISQQWVHNPTRQQDPRSPLVTLLPTSANPTEVLAQRFAAWRLVIRSILVYMTETVSIQDEIVRQQLRLSHAVNFPFFATENNLQPATPEERAIQRFFLPYGNGSIQDLPSILSQYHSQMANGALKTSKELANEVIPRLEDLRGDLLIKMKEIKTLNTDFKNDCGKELQQTKHDLKQFYEAVESARYGSPKQDPYLLKIALEKQIKKQISEENLLHEAFDNLQGSGRELEKVVVMEIQNALTIYARLLGQNAQVVFDCLVSKLEVGFFNKEPVFEWDNFIAKDANFIPPNVPNRRMKDIVYKYQDDPLTYEVKSGFLERRSKFLKSYSKGFYLLTPSYLHEFKTPDRKRDTIPVMSLSLNDCTVAEHSKKGSSEHKFILHAKQNGIIHRGHNWVFRAESFESMMMWFEDLKKLTSTSSPVEKAKFIMGKLNSDSDKKVRQRVSSVKTNGRMTGQRVSTPQQQQQQQQSGNFQTPNLDNQTNTNTSVSIPETEYTNHNMIINQPRLSEGSRDRAYDEGVYAEKVRDSSHFRTNKAGDSGHY